jgi:hypothetical protein
LTPNENDKEAISIYFFVFTTGIRLIRPPNMVLKSVPEAISIFGGITNIHNKPRTL